LVGTWAEGRGLLPSRSLDAALFGRKIRALVDQHGGDDGLGDVKKGLLTLYSLFV
jgi:hypothetical protein